MHQKTVTAVVAACDTAELHQNKQTVVTVATLSNCDTTEPHQSKSITATVATKATMTTGSYITTKEQCW